MLRVSVLGFGARGVFAIRIIVYWAPISCRPAFRNVHKERDPFFAPICRC